MKARETLQAFIRDFDRLMNLRLTAVLEVAKSLRSELFKRPMGLSFRQRKRQLRYLETFIAYCENLLMNATPDRRLVFRDVFDGFYRFTEPLGDKFFLTGVFHPHHNLIFFSPVPLPQVLLSELWKEVAGASIVYVASASHIGSVSRYLTKYLTKNLPKGDVDSRLIDEILIATYRVRAFSRSMKFSLRPLVKYVPVGYARLDQPLDSCTKFLKGEILAVKVADDGSPTIDIPPNVILPSLLVVPVPTGGYTWLLVDDTGDTLKPVIFSVADPYETEWVGAFTAWYSSGIPPPESPYEDSYVDELLDF